MSESSKPGEEPKTGHCWGWFFHRWPKWQDVGTAYVGWQTRACVDCGRQQSRFFQAGTP